jgi:hypothetical protein
MRDTILLACPFGTYTRSCDIRPEGHEKPVDESFVIVAFSRFVLVDVHGEPLPQAARMCAALLARAVAATLVTERNRNHLVVKRPVHRVGARRQSAGLRRGGTCMFAATLGPFGLTPPLTSA